MTGGPCDSGSYPQGAVAMAPVQCPETGRQALAVAFTLSKPWCRADAVRAHQRAVRLTHMVEVPRRSWGDRLAAAGAHDFHDRIVLLPKCPDELRWPGRYADDLPAHRGDAMRTDLEPVYRRLKSILEPYGRRLHVTEERPTTYAVDVAPEGERNPTTWFGRATGQAVRQLLPDARLCRSRTCPDDLARSETAHAGQVVFQLRQGGREPVR